MSVGGTAGAQTPLDQVAYLLKYIECALHHPRPLPEVAHAYRDNFPASKELKDLYHCLFKLYTENPKSESFREPVNALDFNIFNYYNDIKEPMSLHEVLDNISAGGSYHNVQEAEIDVERIWTNAEKFNGPHNTITQYAKDCRAALAELRQRWEDEKEAPEDDVVDAVNEILSSDNAELAKAFTDYLRQHPQLVGSDSADLNMDKVQMLHLRHIRELIRRYIPYS